MGEMKMVVLISCGFLVYFPTVSIGYDLLEDFDKLAFPGRFANAVKDILTKNETEISYPCSSQLSEYAQGIINNQSWTLFMFDAGTKFPPSGVLSGNLRELGAFDQCLNTETNNSTTSIIFGKYCLGTISFKDFIKSKPTDAKILQSLYSEIFEKHKLGNTDLYDDYSATFTACFPNACSAGEIQKIYSELGVFGIKFSENLCQTKFSQPEFTNGDMSAVSFLAVMFFIILISTMYDIMLFYTKKESPHSLLTAFSALTNGKKIIQINENSKQISCLHGIRVISMMWIIFGHRFVTDANLATTNFFDQISWISNSASIFIINATLAVDTFLLLAGMMVAYGFMSSMGKGVKFNIVLYYIHRYLRLAPLLAVMIVIEITLLKHLGSGPYWMQAVTEHRESCEKYWWSALLFLQNYINLPDLCIGQTWYLCVDSQLFLLSPLILVPLQKWPKLGLSFVAFLTICSMVACFLTAWIDKFRGFVIADNEEDAMNFLIHYYFPTHTRAAPWLIGVIWGYYIYELKQKHNKFNKFLFSVLNIISLAILCSCVFAGHRTRQDEYIRIAESLYTALLRPSWAIALGWIIFACSLGYGGPINWFLSLPMFQVVSKLTYSMYLIHILILTIVSTQMRTSIFLSKLHKFYVFWGDFAFTFAASLIFSLAFEFPTAAIEKVILCQNKNEELKPTQCPESSAKSEVI